MKRLFLFFLLILAWSPASAQTFPPLTGRVVDAANILTAQDKAALTGKLESLQQANSRQLVVATIPSLQGYDIADYGYKLGRAWGSARRARTMARSCWSLRPSTRFGSKSATAWNRCSPTPFRATSSRTGLSRPSSATIMRAGSMPGSIRSSRSSRPHAIRRSARRCRPATSERSRTIGAGRSFR